MVSRTGLHQVCFLAAARLPRTEQGRCSRGACVATANKHQPHDTEMCLANLVVLPPTKRHKLSKAKLSRARANEGQPQNTEKCWFIVVVLPSTNERSNATLRYATLSQSAVYKKHTRSSQPQRGAAFYGSKRRTTPANPF